VWLRRDYADAVTIPGKRAAPKRAPTPVRGAGFIVAIEGASALVVAAVLVVRGLVGAGADQHAVNGLGTAISFFLLGAAVLAAGWALVVGRRWGRGLGVFTQLLLLPVVWYLVVGSHQPGFGIPLGLVVLAALCLLFSPAAVRWAAAGDQSDPASSASDEPDTR
jgi:hypothetical protein